MLAYEIRKALGKNERNYQKYATNSVTLLQLDELDQPMQNERTRQLQARHYYLPEHRHVVILLKSIKNRFEQGMFLVVVILVQFPWVF